MLQTPFYIWSPSNARKNLKRLRRQPNFEWCHVQTKKHHRMLVKWHCWSETVRKKWDRWTRNHSQLSPSSWILVTKISQNNVCVEILLWNSPTNLNPNGKILQKRVCVFFGGYHSCRRFTYTHTGPPPLAQVRKFWTMHIAHTLV